MSEDQIYPLPSYDDFLSEAYQIFIPSIINGFTFSLAHNAPLNLKEIGTKNLIGVDLKIPPLKLNPADPGQIPNLFSEISAGLSSTIQNVGMLSVQCSLNSLDVNAICLPSPFVITSYKMMTDYKDFLSVFNINARQPVSCISAVFNMNKVQRPVFSEASAIFGNMKYALGSKFVYDKDGKHKYQVLGLFSTRKSKFFLDFLVDQNIFNNWTATASVKKNAAPGLTFGAQFQLNKELHKQLNIGWDFKFGRSRVQSYISTSKLVNTCFSRKFKNGFNLRLSTAINYVIHDSSIGVELSYTSSE